MSIIFFRTIIIYITMTSLLRLMGKRQVGELESSELISTLFLSDIATLPIANPDIPILYSLLPICMIVSFEVIITFSKNKVNILKRIFEAKPSFLIYKGEIDQKELCKLRISIQELISELRVQEIGDISDVYHAILEENGKLSVIKRASSSPPNASDMGLDVVEKGIAHALILDGCCDEENMLRLNIDKKSLTKMCKDKGHKIEDVFLLTVDDSGDVNLIPKEKRK